MSSHANNGHCPKCQELLDAYPDFNADLREWFEDFQAKHPSAHISCAGRGHLAQEEYFHKGASKAHYGQSAHNFGCALDLFVIQAGLDLYDKNWFETILAPNLEPWLEWYGAPGASFYELPHVEIKAWKTLVAQHLATPVE
jgi:hypothetical protein